MSETVSRQRAQQLFISSATFQRIPTKDLHLPGEQNHLQR